jgi:hypothetical protein
MNQRRGRLTCVFFGRIWGIENSADDFHRVVDGKSYDIHEGNPAEELNYRKHHKTCRSPRRILLTMW